MTKWLIHLFVKDADRVQELSVRTAFGVLAGCVGIAVNLLLCAAKFFIGMVSGSIAIQADAMNNLSDIGGSVVTLIGFRAAGKPADEQHPFGHARIEYIAAMAVAFLVLLVAVELAKESVAKIIAPAAVQFDFLTVGVLLGSILAKLWLGRFTAHIGKRISSKAMQAASMDSLSDVISTGAILVSVLIAYVFQVNLDGYMGVIASLFVLYTGIAILKDTISVLLGEAPDADMVNELQERLLSYEGVLGIHDMIIHNYGPGRIIATVHAEVDSREDILEIHETVDKAEREIGKTMGIMLTIHMDPVAVHDENYHIVYEQIRRAVQDTRADLTFHDFRMVPGENQINLIFDLVIPHGLRGEESLQIKRSIKERLRQVDERYQCVITIDSDYVRRTGNPTKE